MRPRNASAFTLSRVGMHRASLGGFISAKWCTPRDGGRQRVLRFRLGSFLPLGVCFSHFSAIFGCFACIHRLWAWDLNGMAFLPCKGRRPPTSQEAEADGVAVVPPGYEPGEASICALAFPKSLRPWPVTKDATRATMAHTCSSLIDRPILPKMTMRMPASVPRAFFEPARSLIAFHISLLLLRRRWGCQPALGERHLVPGLYPHIGSGVPEVDVALHVRSDLHEVARGPVLPVDDRRDQNHSGSSGAPKNRSAHGQHEEQDRKSSHGQPPCGGRGMVAGLRGAAGSSPSPSRPLYLRWKDSIHLLGVTLEHQPAHGGVLAVPGVDRGPRVTGIVGRDAVVDDPRLHDVGTNRFRNHRRDRPKDGREGRA